LELEKEKTKEQIHEKLEELLKQRRTKQRLCGEGLERVRRRLFGLPPEEKRKNGLSPETLAETERAAKLL